MDTGLLRRILANHSGATAIEYGLIAALVAIAAIYAMQELGDMLGTIMSKTADTLATASAR